MRYFLAVLPQNVQIFAVLPTLNHFRKISIPEIPLIIEIRVICG